jgi:AraC-like DNA-binding protein
MAETDSSHVPELAIVAFERLSGLTVTVHDLEGRLWPFLPPERLMHHAPLCAIVKSGPFGHACIDFSVTQLRQQIGGQRAGRIQVCHAGLIEWVVPVFQQGTDELRWLFFAGQRTAGRLKQAIRDGRSPTPRQWPASAKLPPPVDDDEAGMILESLRQLAARLSDWMAQFDDRSPTPAADAPPQDLPARRAWILRFIRLSHVEPIRLADIAERLSLSEGRAGHLIREACGKTFVELVNEARVRTAAALLRHSDLPVAQVALRAGWGDVSRFHRVFRAHTGTTPMKYRRLTDQERLMKTDRQRTLD